ncbi:MAG: phage tail family protein [Ruthenibacterium sp.]
MKHNVIVKWLRSDGRIFLADGIDWGILAITGIGSVTPELFTEKRATGDGSILTGKRIGDREHSYTLRNQNTFLNEMMRGAVISFFNPKYTYKVYVTYQGRTRWIDAELLLPAIPSENVCQAIEVTITMLSSDVFFKSMDEFGKDIAGIEPRFGWPLYDIAGKGFIYSTFNFAKTVLLENDGDVACYCKAVIEATAEVKNPKLMHGDATVRIIDTMLSTDTYVIDMLHKTVLKNGKNALVKIDRNSDFSGMAFSVGDNAISFGADTGENALKVTLYFNKLYLGV